MLLSFAMVLVLSAPRAPAGAELVTYVPKLDAVDQVMPFFTAAGTRSVILRPGAWKGEAHPLLSVDVTSRDSLSGAGIDPAGALTLSKVGDRVVSCVSLSDAALYSKLCDEKLARLGTPFTQQEGGATVKASRDPLNRVLAAYVVQGKESCAISGNGLTVEKQLGALAKTLTKPATGAGFTLASQLRGVGTFVVPGGAQSGAVAVAGKGLALTLDGRSKGLPVAQLAGPGTSPYAAFAPDGMLVVRARFAKSQMPMVLDEVARRIPGGGALGSAAKLLAPMLTGNVALFVSHVKVTSGLRSNEARFFALRLAMLAEAEDAAAAKALVEGVDPASLAARGGKLELGASGATIFLSNDPSVKDAALGALASAAGKQAHAAEATMDPKLLARGLAQVPLLEAVQAPELAGLVAAATELGPLLLASEKVNGWLDLGTAPGQHRGQLTWTLDAAKFATDAGQ